MLPPRMIASVALCGWLLACARPPQSETSAVPASASASAAHDTTSERADTTPPPAADEPEREKFDTAAVASRIADFVHAGDLDAAASALEQAKAGPGGSSPEGRHVVAYYEATLLAYRQDFAGAAQRIVEYLADGGDEPTDPTGFYDQNSLIMLRLAESNPEAALVECYQAAELGRTGTWSLPDTDRETAVRLKELWHRGYVLRMLAERAKEPRRGTLVRYADQSRRAYAALASTQEGYGDSIAVLDAYFAVQDGDKAAAAAASARVDYANNGDLEDLYLTYMGFDFAGKTEEASAVREKILATKAVYLAVPIVRRWLERDAINEGASTPAWTPRYPLGTP